MEVYIFVFGKNRDSELSTADSSFSGASSFLSDCSYKLWDESGESERKELEKVQKNDFIKSMHSRKDDLLQEIKRSLAESKFFCTQEASEDKTAMLNVISSVLSGLALDIDDNLKSNFDSNSSCDSGSGPGSSYNSSLDSNSSNLYVSSDKEKAAIYNCKSSHPKYSSAGFFCAPCFNSVEKLVSKVEEYLIDYERYKFS